MTLFNLQIDDATASHLGQLAKQRQLTAVSAELLAHHPDRGRPGANG